MPGWIGMQQLIKLLGVGRRQFNDLRLAIGDTYEHKDGRTKASPIYIFAPDWLLLWSRLRTRNEGASTTTGETADHHSRLKKAQADKAEIELAKLRGELITAEEWQQDIRTLCIKIREGIELLAQHSTEAQHVMIDKLDEVAEIFGREPIDASNGSTSKNGKATRKAKPRKKLPAKSSAKPS